MEVSQLSSRGTDEYGTLRIKIRNELSILNYEQISWEIVDNTDYLRDGSSMPTVITNYMTVHTSSKEKKHIVAFLALSALI